MSRPSGETKPPARWMRARSPACSAKCSRVSSRPRSWPCSPSCTRGACVTVGTRQCGCWCEGRMGMCGMSASHYYALLAL
eukprot:363433-Chlamydomonas_euryale.AAC.7